ncbi:DUF559 domain-containing protein [Propionicicella superfundia]|uniref:DUF559 domain-containing protein n=1 Tax=Propionicicella superfundia TaxID=348582 RepID=UPI0004238A62|nr:DUF559 domain-containing protein [Propionicicella superfundia]
MRGRELVEAILEAEHGVLAIRSWRRLRSTVWRLVTAGALVRVFPGVYVVAGTEQGSEIWLRALCAWKRDGVISGDTARMFHNGSIPARAGELGRVVVDRPVRARPRGRVRFRRRVHGARVAGGGIRIATPVMAAVDRAGHDDGRAIDDLLREQHADPAQFSAVLPLFRHTRGNPVRRRVVTASLSAPYSYAERELHRLLKRARIGGWVANVPLRLEGQVVRPDVLLPEGRLVLEVDGREFHTGPTAFEQDRERQNLLVTHGYRVLRFTVAMLRDDPEGVIRVIRRGLRAEC